MGEEEKGFIIRDKRSFDEKGDVKKEAEEAEEKEKAGTEQKAGGAAGEEAPREGAQSPPLPEVNFSSLIMSLSSSALIHLGEIADPNTGKTVKDLPLAKHSIDIIAMLKEKTERNLKEDEQKFLDSILADIRWRYVKAAE
jgi:hypothetical protein